MIRRLGTTLGTTLALARAGLAVNRARTLTALAGMTAALALVAGSASAGQFADAYATSGLVLAAAVSAATAAAVDRRQLRAAAVVHLLGASAGQRRLTVVAEGVLIGLAALGPALALVALAGRVAGPGTVAAGDALWTATLVPAVLGLFVGRLRRTVTVLDAEGPGPDVAAGRLAARVARLAGGVAALWVAARVGGSLNDFSELDLFFWPAVVLACGGLLLAVPVLVDAAAAALRHLPGTAAPLAGTLLARRRRLVAPAAALGAVAALVVTVNAVLGLGLAQREAARRAALGSRYDFTAGLAADQVIISSELAGFVLPTLAVQDELPPALVPAAMAGRVRALQPRARLGRVVPVPARVVADPAVPASRDVGVATPELLAALGLDRYAADVAAGRAIVLDPTAAPRGEVVLRTLAGAPAQGFSGLPAVVAQTARIPRDLPAALVPPTVAESLWRARGKTLAAATRVPDQLVVRLPGPARPADVAGLSRLAASMPAEAPGGGSAYLRADWGDAPVVRPFDDSRLDGTGAVTIRTPADLRVAAGLIGLVSLVALATALRLAALTGRAEEDLLEVVGAPLATLRRVATWQAAVLAALAVPAGVVAGLVAVGSGIASYNADGRFGPGGALPRIPFSVPASLVVVAVAVPVVATAAAWLAAGRRPEVDPVGLADRVAW